MEKSTTKGKDEIDRKWKGMCHTQHSDKSSEESPHRSKNL